MISHKRLQQRAGLMCALRSFFSTQGFLEVDTPIRQPVIIPERYIEPLRSGAAYLQASPELCMKRLLAGGCTKIFQICHCFRKNERGSHHLEEFTLLEWYRSGSTYLDLMDDCELLFRGLAEMLSPVGQEGGEDVVFQGIDVTGPWERLKVAEAFERYSPVSLSKALRNNIFDEVLVEHVEPRLGIPKPVFLMDYPLELGSLARQKDTDPDVVERFELYVGGVELANGFSELTDENEQRRRFKEEMAVIQQDWGPDIVLPERFLQDLHKIDRAAGIALGVDRLFMLGFGIKSIAEAVSFSKDDFL